MPGGGRKPETRRYSVRVGQIGFGRAGRCIATALLGSASVELAWVLQDALPPSNRSATELLGLTSEEFVPLHTAQHTNVAELLDREPVDAIVDFSSSEGIFAYGDEAAQRGITILTAVSSYPEETITHLTTLADRTVVLRSPNITLGVNFLIIAAKALKGIVPTADIAIVEEHFKGKREVSGTAQRIASVLEVPQEEINTVRAGGIVGVHEVIVGLPHETVRLKHESISREAFGAGVIFALEHLRGKPNGLYRMEDLLLPLLHQALTTTSAL